MEAGIQKGPGGLVGGLGLETGGADRSWAVWRPKGKTEGGVVEALAGVRP